MLKAMLERRTKQTLTKAEFAIICEIATDDIKLNRISFKKCTNLEYLLNIAERSSIIFKKCA